MDKIIEVKMKSGDVVTLTSNQLKKLSTSNISYAKFNQRYVLHIFQNNKYKSVMHILYGDNKGHKIRYKDGNQFNIVPSNIIIESIKKPDVEKVYNDKKHCISAFGKLLKFDAEDYKKVKSLGIYYNKKRDLLFVKKSYKSSTTLTNFLFGTNGSYIVFKDGDNTNFRKSNMIFTDKNLILKRKDFKYTGVHKDCSGYRVTDKENKYGGIYRCSYDEAGAIYNYLKRKQLKLKNYKLNNTPFSVEEENKIAEKCIKIKNEIIPLTHKIDKKTTSIYYGVSFNKSNNKWVCKPAFKGTRYYLGSFSNEIDAADAYNKKAIEIFGDKAILNNIE